MILKKTPTQFCLCGFLSLVKRIRTMRKRKRVSTGLKDAAREGYLLGLKVRALREGAFPLALKAGGISETQLHVWAVANGLSYSKGILAVDRRASRPVQPAFRPAGQAGPAEGSVHPLAV
jgi:hypothetical protein